MQLVHKAGLSLPLTPFVYKHEPVPIILAETFAALTAIIKRAHNHTKQNTTLEINLYTDNMATLYFIKKGSCRWSIPIEIHFKILKVLLLINDYVKIIPHWIPSEDNPADYYSRIT